MSSSIYDTAAARYKQTDALLTRLDQEYTRMRQQELEADRLLQLQITEAFRQLGLKLPYAASNTEQDAPPPISSLSREEEEKRLLVCMTELKATMSSQAKQQVANSASALSIARSHRITRSQ